MAKVFVITGPSGVGKGTLIRILRERALELGLSTSATARPPAPGGGGGRGGLSERQRAERVQFLRR